MDRSGKDCLSLVSWLFRSWKWPLANRISIVFFPQYIRENHGSDRCFTSIAFDLQKSCRTRTWKELRKKFSSSERGKTSFKYTWLISCKSNVNRRTLHYQAAGEQTQTYNWRLKPFLMIHLNICATEGNTEHVPLVQRLFFRRWRPSNYQRSAVFWSHRRSCICHCLGWSFRCVPWRGEISSISKEIFCRVYLDR